MHIAFWSPAWPLAKFQNGIITYVHAMRREFQARGHRVSVFTQVLDPSADDPGVYQVRPLHRRFWRRVMRRLSRSAPANRVFEFSLDISAEILRVHRNHPIDVMEMEESFGWFSDVARSTSIPLIVKLHGPAFLSLVHNERDSQFGKEKILREGRALATAAAIISPCLLTLNQTVSKYGLAPPLKCRVVNPLAMEPDTPIWRLDHCDRNTILFVGRFDLLKGADIMLNAFLRLLNRRPRLKLIFAGPDLGIPGPHGRRIQFAEYCASLFPAQFRNRVDFRGPVANQQVAKLRIESMVTVVASRQENLAYTMLEAMFQGCPLVSTDAGGCPESVSHAVTGLLARSEDPEDFACKIEHMLDNPEEAAAMGEAARQHVIAQHSISKVAATMLDIYKDVMSERNQRRVENDRHIFR